MLIVFFQISCVAQQTTVKLKMFLSTSQKTNKSRKSSLLRSCNQKFQIEWIAPAEIFLYHHFFSLPIQTTDCQPVDWGSSSYHETLIPVVCLVPRGPQQFVGTEEKGSEDAPTDPSLCRNRKRLQLLQCINQKVSSVCKEKPIWMFTCRLKPLILLSFLSLDCERKPNTWRESRGERTGKTLCFAQTCSVWTKHLQSRGGWAIAEVFPLCGERRHINIKARSLH